MKETYKYPLTDPNENIIGGIRMSKREPLFNSRDEPQGEPQPENTTLREPIKKDPWKHRSTNMLCSSCMFYVPKESHSNIEIGRCRRHAPTLGGFPAVFPYDWCGDHKLDEEKLVKNG